MHIGDDFTRRRFNVINKRLSLFVQDPNRTGTAKINASGVTVAQVTMVDFILP
jgi:hypothetical protein